MFKIIICVIFIYILCICIIGAIVLLRYLGDLLKLMYEAIWFVYFFLYKLIFCNLNKKLNILKFSKIEGLLNNYLFYLYTLYSG